MPIRLNKKNKPYFICGRCENRLEKGSPYCFGCGVVDEQAAEFYQKKHEEDKRSRFERVSREFEDYFDEGFTTVAFDLIKRLKCCTVWQLLVAFQESGVLDRFADKDKFKVIPKEMRTLGNKKYVEWARRRIRSLGRWWQKEKVVFLATTVEQGHPYLFILPGNVPEDVKEVKTKAEWSIRQTMRHNFANIQEKVNEMKIAIKNMENSVDDSMDEGIH